MPGSLAAVEKLLGLSGNDWAAVGKLWAAMEMLYEHRLKSSSCHGEQCQRQRKDDCYFKKNCQNESYNSKVLIDIYITF